MGTKKNDFELSYYSFLVSFESEFELKLKSKTDFFLVPKTQVKKHVL